MSRQARASQIMRLTGTDVRLQPHVAVRVFVFRAIPAVGRSSSGAPLIESSQVLELSDDGGHPFVELVLISAA